LEAPLVIANPAPYLRWAKTRRRVTHDLASSGLQPVTTEELLGDAIAKDAISISGQNDEGLPALREAIAARYRMPIACVSIAPAAAGANFLSLLALLEHGDEALMETPVYDPLIAAARAAGATVRHFERLAESGFVIDPERIRAGLTPRTKFIVISNAHNPTGALTPPEVLARIGDIAASAGAIVLVDEVYAEAQHTYSPPPPPAATLGDMFVSTNSLTKAYGLAGLRCGWVLASPSISERIRIARDVVDGSGPFVTESLAVVAFEQIAALRARARAILSTNLAALRAMASGHPRLEWIEPEAGTTVFPRLRDVRDATAFVDDLIAKHDTVVVPGHFFQKAGHIRISFGGEPTRVAASLQQLDAALRAYTGS